ncbi:family 31 glycosyl hydrolase [Microdochium trichocladiopsis]|uniref:Family 31 glycosyl hydrolase n=1 Tax=Microdochium trichocladiopsis TaxID=1682393 RepID=A0A9P8Y2B8_9PEZI|nr:family 31 glycosyl hydrolase [Microdochium trichocladiopsis]KAH7025897.1 family 31 glycosyl hydrolase [Microdochium trichocladiopsis]
MASLLFLAAVVSAASSLTSRDYTADPLAACPGYKASNVQTTDTGLTAELTLAGTACNVYGTDLDDLVLSVSYDTETRLHVKIQDAANNVYQVPESVFPRPQSAGVKPCDSALKFEHTENPFSFKVSRSDTGEVLFDTSAASLVFESQYLRLRTALPDDPNLYGLGEHSDPFRLNTTDYIRTLWSQDAYGVPTGSNLYGNHPVYYEHRATGSHGVFLLNSNGMDIKINRTEQAGQYLEYNTLGGVVDLYFVAGPSPVEVARQYAGIVGLPAMMPYWGLGFHQCRYGYRDAYNVAEVVYNYSQAAIPLETMWTDIDYMYRRRVFSLDPERFPLEMMRGLVDHLHANDQHYVVMVDPAVAYFDFPKALQRGIDDDIFLLRQNGSLWRGVVWPGVTVFPDWFAKNIQEYWNNEFNIFFDPETGVDISALWIDMNEPSDFPCFFPCDDPDKAAIGYPPEPPPVRSPPRPLPGWPCEFQPEGCSTASSTRSVQGSRDLDTVPNTLRHDNPFFIEPRQESGQQQGLPGRDLLFPKYAIHNKAAYEDSWNAAEGGISNKTVNTDVIHHNGLAMYDTHNLYGTMMSSASAEAMRQRKPDLRPMIITRSTFAGAGAKVGHWLGDNLSIWDHYRLNIRSAVAFAAIYQVPMVGADVCGFGANTTEQLCARWATLGAFLPFYRNHNSLDSTDQEFYRWPSVAAAAKAAMDIRYRLLDYMYTALQAQHADGTPLLNPVFYLYPQDKETFPLELQYFLGQGIMVAPVTAENATSVDVYFPDDTFYDWHTLRPVPESYRGQTVTVDAGTDWGYIPLYLRGGVIVPLRVNSQMTTTALREQDFEILVPLGGGKPAHGKLYLDDGVSEVQPAESTSDIAFSFDPATGELVVSGPFGYQTKSRITKVTFLGLAAEPSQPPSCDGQSLEGGEGGGHHYHWDGSASTLVVELDQPLTRGFTLKI